MIKTPETIPYRIVRESMRAFIISAALFSVSCISFGGAIFSGLQIALKLTNVEIGILSSIVSISLLFQVPGVLLQQRYFSKSRFCILFSLIFVGFWAGIMMLVIGWMHLPDWVGVGLFFLCYGGAQVAAQLAAPVTVNWTGSLVPARESNRFWTQRQAVLLVSCSVGFILVGMAADKMGSGKLSTYAIILALGVVLQLAGLWVLRRAADTSVPRKTQSRPLLQIRLVFHNAKLRTLILFFGLQALLLNFATPFIFIYLKSDVPGQGMGYSVTEIQLFMAMANLVGFVGGYFFRIVGDRYGRKPFLILCFALKVLEFILYGFLVPTAGLGIAIPLFALGGFVNTGIACGQLSLLSSTGNARINGVAIGVFYSVTGIMGFCGSFCSGYLYDGILLLQQNFDWWILKTFAPFNLLSFLSALGLASVLPILCSFREEGAGSTLRVVRSVFGNINPVRTIYRAYAISRPQTERRRLDLLKTAEGDLVVAALLNDLYSPSTEVREATILAISRMEDAVPAPVERELIKMLNSSDLSIRPLAARALGHLRSRAALPHLLRFFGDRDVAFAQTCVYAAGLMENASVADALGKILESNRAEVLWAVAAEALGKIGDWRHTRLIYRAYRTEHQQVLRRQSLIALCRTIMRDHEYSFSSFEKEDRIGTEVMEEHLSEIARRIPGAPAVPQLLAALDADRPHRMLADLLMPLLRKNGTLNDGETLSSLFVPGSETLRPGKFAGETREDVQLWVLLHFWAELRYYWWEADRALPLAALLILREHLQEAN